MKQSKLLTIPQPADRMLPAPTHLRRLFVALVVLLTMTAQTAWAETVTLTSETGEVTLNNGDVLTGSGGANTHVIIANGATVTLSNVTINSIPNDENHTWAGINCAGNATIILADGSSNTIKGAYRHPGIFIPEGYTLTISGSGTLNASSASDNGAGIGGGNLYDDSSNGCDYSCGNIVINGGTINATGGSNSAGIGAGRKSRCGTITINEGVTKIVATNGSNATYSVGPGRYEESTCGTVTIHGVETGPISGNYTYDSSIKYTVHFGSNGGTGSMDDLSLCIGQPAVLPNCLFSKENYVFSGWSTSAGGDLAYKNNQTVMNLATENNAIFTLYSLWKEPIVTLTSSDRNVTLYDGQTLSGTGGSDTHVTIADGATVTLNAVDITTRDNEDTDLQYARLTCVGDATIILTNGTTNSIKNSYSQPGITVAKGHTLTIQGEGTLNVTGGKYAAGIGAGYSEQNSTKSYCGNIIILGGTITAQGGYGAAGIGAGCRYSECGSIYIKDANVTAIGGDNAAGIGSGRGYNSATFSSICGNITIVSGTISATKGTSATNSIGVGLYGVCGTVTIGGVEGAISTSPYNNTIVSDTYTVSFNANGGSGSMSDQTITCGMATPLTSSTFTRDNYVFIGWSTTAEGEVEYTNRQAVTNLTEKNQTKTLYAKWMTTDGIPAGLQVDPDYAQTVAGFYYVNMPADRSSISVNINAPKYYTFKIYDNGGKDGDYYCSNAYTQSATFTVPEGYKIGLNGTITINKNQTYDVLRVYDGSSSSATMLYTYNFNTHSVNTSSTSNSITLEFESKVTVSTSPYPDKGFDITATVAPVNYTVSFNANGGEGSMAVQNFAYNEGAKALTQNAYTRTGYTFAGWNTKADGTGTDYADQADISNLTTRDGTVIELFAKWNIITYTLTYNGLEGATFSTDKNSYTIESEAITLDTPTKDGYTFAGWFDNAEFTGSAVTTIAKGSTGDKTFWAKWIQDLTYGGVTIKDNGTTKSATLDASQEGTISITSDVVVNAVELNRDFTANQPATVMLPFSLGTGQTVSGGSFYKFSGVTKDGDVWKALFTVVATLKANTPYLFMPSATGQMTFNLNGGTVTLNTTTTGDAGSTSSNWEFRGTYAKVQWDGTTSDPSDLSKTYGFAKGNATIAAGQFVHFAAGAWLKPMRCYLVYNGSTEGGTFQNARSMTRGAASTEELPQTITVVLLSSSGETTGIGTLDTKTGDITLDGWYTMDGRKLEGKPTKKGLYINNGRKIVIK